MGCALLSFGSISHVFSCIRSCFDHNQSIYALGKLAFVGCSRTSFSRRCSFWGTTKILAQGARRFLFPTCVAKYASLVPNYN
jgi:hypothetical protein